MSTGEMLGNYTLEEFKGKVNRATVQFLKLEKKYLNNDEVGENNNPLSNREEQQLAKMKKELALLKRVVKIKEKELASSPGLQRVEQVKKITAKLSTKANLIYGLEGDIKKAVEALNKGQHYWGDGKKKKEAAEQLVEFAKSVNAIAKKLLKLKNDANAEAYNVHADQVDKYLGIVEQTIKMADAVIQIRNTSAAKAFMADPTDSQKGYKWAMDAAEGFDHAWAIADMILSKLGADKIPALAVPLKYFKSLFSVPKVFVGAYIDILKTRDKQLKDVAGLSTKSGSGHVGTNGSIIRDIPSQMAGIYASMYMVKSNPGDTINFERFIKKHKSTLEGEDESFAKALKILLDTIANEDEISETTRESWRAKVLSLAAQKSKL